MRALLGCEAEAFFQSYEKESARGLRINTAKLTAEEFERIVPFPVRRVPWVRGGYFYSASDRPSQSPLYQAGVYYLQEPSAMTPADRLEIAPGDRVLDLCAAPGGKATQILAKLVESGTPSASGRAGQLVANEISAARGRALLRNLELFGARNCLVTNERPDRLAACFPGYFDKILVDAPCSGEGMFRRREEVARAWSEEKVAELSALQRQILEQAFLMLKEGGLLLYSTCTFSPAENEANVAEFLFRHPEMELLPIRPYEGFSPGRPDWAREELIRTAGVRRFPEVTPRLEHILESLTLCVRIWPHMMEGEGHFLALMRKRSDAGASKIAKQGKRTQGKKAAGFGSAGHPRGRADRGRQTRSPRESERLVKQFLDEIGMDLPMESIEFRGDNVYLTMDLPVEAQRLHFLRRGGWIGELKKSRFEPSQPFALMLRGEDCRAGVSFPLGDRRLAAFLSGDVVRFEPGCEPSPGWKLVLADKYPVGWGKVGGGVLKNHIPKSWRIQAETANL
jgi:16S rRNA C967 or C1407 C5-methylase (RsmB/RsmF family)/NOL1/NOP2/fmu family ribosome biogenesis protein